LQALPERVYGVMYNDTLLAIPFFTFMGLILERSGMAEDLLETIGQLFGSIRGGIAYAVVFVGALLAATTGVVAASVISMGLISLPIMLRYGYDRRVASGVIAASGTLAQIIPPSLVLIVMADQLGRSVGDMYEGAFVPGLLLALLYAIYIFFVQMFFPKATPGLPLEAQTLREPQTAEHPLILPVALIGAAASSWFFVAHLGLFDWTASTFERIGAGMKVTEGVWLVVMFAVFSKPFIGVIRPVTMSLFLVICVATAIAIYAMSYATSVKNGADYVVLTMAIAVSVSFAIAVVNRLLSLVAGLNLLSKLAEQVVFVMVPPIGLIFLVLGTIFIGVATPTEGGAMGATGALILAMMKRRLTWDLVRQATESTAKLSAFVVFILLGARTFSLTFYGVDGHRWVEDLLVSLPGGQVGFLAFVNVFVFFLAFFLDFFEIAFIIIPLLGPAAEHIGIDLIWFGVILGVNMQTSFMHPPFGFALFYFRSVAPKESYIDRVSSKRMDGVTTGQIYWGAIPFVIIQCIMVGLVIAFPAMVMHYKGLGTGVDPNKVNIQIELPPLDTEPPKFQ
jgi:tripartite ATP-independent transporter DctM subunit